MSRPPHSGGWGAYREASPPPARHRPGARFARRERCSIHCIADQPGKGVFTMSFTSWLRNLQSALAPSRLERKYRKLRPLRATTHRLQLEALQDPRLPSFLAPLTYAVGTAPHATLPPPPAPAKRPTLTPRA